MSVLKWPLGAALAVAVGGGPPQVPSSRSCRLGSILRVKSGVPVGTGMAKAPDEARRAARDKKEVGRLTYLIYPSLLRLVAFWRSPAAKERVLDVELIEDFADRLIDEVLHGLRLMVEGGHRRENDRSHLGGQHHIAQVPEVKRRLAGNEHQLAPFLQCDVGRAHQKVLAEGVGDPRESLHRAGCDDHPVGLK